MNASSFFFDSINVDERNSILIIAHYNKMTLKLVTLELLIVSHFWAEEKSISERKCLSTIYIFIIDV